MQSRKGSMIEVVANTAIGYVIAVITQRLVFPIFGIVVPVSTDLAIGVIFTIVSLIRGYALRRFFNWLRRAEILV